MNHEPSGLQDAAGNAVPYFSMEATNRTLPAASVADARVEEGLNATLDFAVTLSAAPATAVTVDYATADGTATAGRGLRGRERHADVRGPNGASVAAVHDVAARRWLLRACAGDLPT